MILGSSSAKWSRALPVDALVGTVSSSSSDLEDTEVIMNALRPRISTVSAVMYKERFFSSFFNWSSVVGVEVQSQSIVNAANQLN